MRERGRELGYAIAVHGTLKRDIDLVAIPWTDEAVSARELCEAIFKVVETVCGHAHYSWYMSDPRRGPWDMENKVSKGVGDANFARDYTLAGAPGRKPHGRLGWVINLTMEEGPYIDLAVMPREVKSGSAT
jgi:hypothetical protein